jgi:hypothetical protein
VNKEPHNHFDSEALPFETFDHVMSQKECAESEKYPHPYLTNRVVVQRGEKQTGIPQVGDQYIHNRYSAKTV